MTTLHRSLTTGLILATGFLASASADTITVCLDGTCDFTDPAAAAAVAVSGDVIEIAAGTYLMEEPATLYAQEVSIRGEVDAQGEPATIFDGQNKNQVFAALHISEETELENLVFTNGRAEYGGAMHCHNFDATLRNCVWRDNLALFNGGAMFLNGDSNPTFIDCKMINNRAAHPVWENQGAGGAIWVSTGSVTLRDCVVSGNSAEAHTGAIFSSEEDALVLIRSRVCNNDAPDAQIAEYINVINLGGCVTDDCDSCETSDPADFNRDGVVNGQDLALILAFWGTPNSNLDLNVDGIVNGADLTLLLAEWD